MASCVEIRRTGIDPLGGPAASGGVWFLEVYGDPSQLGFAIAQGSIARQWDSAIPGALWAKTGPNATDWTAISSPIGTQIISTTNLPDLTGYMNAQVLDVVTNPFTTPPGLTSPDDFAFARQTGNAPG